MRNYRRRTVAILLTLTSFATPSAVAAQAPQSPSDSGSGSVSAGAAEFPAPTHGDTARRTAGHAAEFRWYHAGAVLGGVAVVSLLDETVRNQFQTHRTSGKDDVARAFRRMGQVEVFGTVGLGTIAVGLISGHPEIRRAGERISAGLLLAGTLGVITKEVVGRRRPDLTGSAYRFKPFSGRDSWPSGHTTMAFALATSVSDEIHSTPVTVGLYSAAALTGWSRLNDNRHWLSDVLAGAALGITSAKMMNGRLRVFGVGAPKFLLEPDAVGLSFQF